MKTPVILQVRVEPERHAELEAVHKEGETLAELVEESVRSATEFRRVQDEFHSRGEAAWQKFRRTGEAHSTGEVVAELRKSTEARRRQLAR